ncbi:MAG: hypothetical protein LDL33_00150 [Desulfomonile sp.]|nr:hypothetical protein [Desulfomonile sp.]
MAESERCVDHCDGRPHSSGVKAGSSCAALLEQLFYLSNFGMFVVAPDGQVIAANPAARSCLGLDFDPKGHSLQEILPQAKNMLQSSSQSVAKTITRGAGKHGRTIELTCDPIDTAGNRLILLRDVTNLRHMSERRLRMEQLAAAGKMAARLTHEIRNPLAGIFAGLQTFRAESSLSVETRFLVDLVLDQARSVERTLKRLVDATSSAIASARRIDVEVLLKESVETVSEVACGRNVEVRLLTGPSGLAMIADAKAMRRALRNLLENSLEALRSGGLIKLGWRVLGKGEQRTRLPGHSGIVMGIYGEDTGEGIPEDLSTSATYRPFAVSKTASTGLGLAVAQNIVEAHGGLLCLSRAPGGGTSFEILLPANKVKPCWETRNDENYPCRPSQVTCDGCEVKASGSGLLCWLEVGGEHGTEKFDWLAECVECPIFRRRSLWAPV